MQFLMLVIDGPGNPANPNEIQHIDAFNEKMSTAGQLKLAVGIKGPIESIWFDNRSNKGEEHSGSFFKNAEHYSVFWMIEVDSYETAQALAKEGSLACNRKVELRPLY
jgi:hypothetical protein